MTPAEFCFHYHEKVFRLVCHERKGAEFQRFFEEIMLKHEPSFTPVKPHGREGDWKNDGWIPASGTLFQSYAPEELGAAKIIAKIKADFHGARAKWAGKMKEWIFVYAEQGKLPPMVVSHIEDLRAAHAELIIGTWNREQLWRIVRGLSMADRNSLLEPVPALAAVVNTTAAEVQTLLNYVARIDQPIRDSGTNLLDLLPKLERNRLGPAIHGLVEPGLTVARVVADYIVRHPDPEFNAAISQSLANRYSQVATEHPDDPEQVFFVLIRWVQSGTPETADHPRYFWAAVGIVSHYFELCDIFES